MTEPNIFLRHVEDNEVQASVMQTGGVDEAYLSPTSLATHYILGTDTSAPKIAILR